MSDLESSQNVSRETIEFLRNLKDRPKRVQNFPVSHPCARCGKDHWRLRTNGYAAGYCEECHAANMREWRKTHKLEGDALKRAHCRSYSHLLIKRGKIMREPCRVCGEKAQMHHPDYDNPYLVEWLCRECHLNLHKIEGGGSEEAA